MSQFRMIRPADGAVIWLEERAHGVCEGPDETVRLVGVVMDVTERKRTEANLCESEARFEFVRQSSGVGFWYCDLPFDVLRWDGLVKTHFHLPPDAHVTIDAFYDRIHPEDREPTRSAIQRSLDEHAAYDVDYRTVHPQSGDVKWIRAIGRTFYAADGSPTRFDGVTLDVTDRKQAEEALRRSEAQLAAELSAAGQLQQVSTALIRGGDDRSLYDILMDAAVAIMRSDFASMQVLYPARGKGGELKLLAFRGFEPDAIARWEWVDADSTCGCGKALKTSERCIVDDMETCDWMAGTPDLQAYRAAGIRAMQSTPLVSRSGQILGMISTHWRRPHEPAPHELRSLDVLARQAADLLERRQAEEALRQSEAQFRTLADNISQFAWTADASGWIYWYNQRWYDYTGTTLEEMQGWGWTQVHHPDHLDRVVARVQRSWDTGEVWEDTFPLRGNDGQYRWFLSRAVPIRDEAGNVLRWFGTNTDVSDQLAAEQALKDADRRKDEFLATLAHELRNPLAPLRNGLQLMHLSGDDPEAVEQVRTMMERQLSQMVRLVDDLLDVSRITRGQLELRRERVELAPVVASAVETSRPVVEAGGHQLTVSLPAEPIYVDADATRLAQVFANLLNNAAKYSEPGGRIVLEVSREKGIGVRGQESPVSGSNGQHSSLTPDSCLLTPDHIVVEIKDEGVGIPSEMLSKIFDMFTQVDRSLERSQGGLGIGLTLVKRLIEMHGGSVEARSDGRGQGSTFLVRLPVAHATPPATVRLDGPSTLERPATVESRRCRVLVADDNVDSAISLATLLKLASNDVRTVHDGQQAVDAAEQFQPDVILLDIGMPNLNGYEACRRIRREPWGKPMKLIALTGWGQDEDRKQSQDAGFDAHLVKPVDYQALKRLLDAARAEAPR